jgi:hypothetical protein
VATITVLRPDVEAPVAQGASLAPRAPRRDGMRVVLVENGKPRARELLTLVGEGMAAELGGLSVEVVGKPSASWAVSPEQVAEIAASADLVVTGLGDCGGCSANSLADAVALERAGVPATAVITEPFEALVASYATRLGLPGYPVVVLAHPVASLSEAELRALATKAVPAVLSRLLSD